MPAGELDIDLQPVKKTSMSKPVIWKLRRSISRLGGNEETGACDKSREGKRSRNGASISLAAIEAISAFEREEKAWQNETVAGLVLSKY